MQTVKTAKELSELCRSWHRDGQTVALVPTMGYYHDGHAALMDKARGLGDKVVVSLFVNPTQFGPNEDYASYPRDFERDRAVAEAHGADALFAPSPPSSTRPMQLPGSKCPR